MEQQEFKNQLDALRSIITDGVAYFSAWRTIANLNEDEAHALNRYRGFFSPARNSLRAMALLQFAKVFDRDARTISLCNLLSAAKDNPILFVPYAKEGDLEKLECKLNSNEQLLNHLKSYRDQRLAHHDQKVSKDTSLQFGIVRQLIEDVKDMHDALGTWHERSTTSFDLLTYEAEQHTSDVKRIMCEELDRAKQKIQDTYRKIRKSD